jgi:prolipoprotein diacylglyceryltransferase
MRSLAGLEPLGYHVVSLAAHAAGAVLLLLWLRRRGVRDRAVFGSYLLAAGTLRFLIELIRVNAVVALGMTTAQLFSAGLVVAGIWLLAARGDTAPALPLAQGRPGRGAVPARRAKRR